MRKTEFSLRRTVFGLFLFLSVSFVAMAQQQVTVTGKVTDSDGGPLPGVNIVVVGTTEGTITDINGNYIIEVPGDAELRFNFIGFESQVIPVNNRTTINVTLQEDVQTLDEVVVVGYGQMKRSDLTGSVVSVSEDAIQQSVPTSIDQVLQGRAAGVQIQQNSGTPGGSSSIRIRGINSLNASNEPIFVVDGVIIDGSTGSSTENALASINPNDIVSMDVLKDASATAIYGSRAANGVIIITTRQGEAGKSRVSYDGYYGLQEMPTKLDLLNLRQYAQHKNDRTDAGIVEADDYFVRADLLGEGTDWQEELFQVASMQSHNLSLTGGTDKSTYALGAGYLDQEGIAIGSGFERLSLRGNFDSDVNDWLKLGVNFALSNSEQQVTVEDASLIETAMKQTPNVAVRSADGSFDGPDTDMYVQTNPVGLAMLRENRNEKTNIRSNVFGEVTPLEGLTLKTEFSSDLGVNNTYEFNPSYQFGAITNEVVESERAKSYSKFWSWRNVLTFNRSFVDVHNLNFMLGQEMQKSHWEYLYGYRAGFVSNVGHDLNLGDGNTARANGSSGGNAIASYFGRAFYSFDDRYLLTTTLRYDGSSKFAEDYRWGWFPSAAFAWKISNESFLRDHPVINNLKLRFGWGLVGNQNVSFDYPYTSTMESVTTVWGTGLLSGNMANPELQWESTNSSNIGLDINLFRNRIEFIGDVYYKKTKDLLLQVPLPAYLGTEGQGSTSPPWANVGSLENKGIELTLNTVNIDRGDFLWRTNLVFSLNRSRVVELDTESSTLDKTIQEGSDITIVTRTAVDEPIGQFYGYRVIGRFNEATDFYYKDSDGNVKPVAIPEGLEISESGVWIGDYIFDDRNGDGVINDEDRQFIGNPEPKFTYGIGNTLSFKGFDLSVYLNGVYGNDVLNYQKRWLENPRENHNLLTSALDYARVEKIDPDGPVDFRNMHVTGGDPMMPRMSASSSNANNRMSDRFIEDGSFLRIQNISLSYTLPGRWLRNLFMNNVRVYAKLQNVYTFTKYSGYDPEVGAYQQDALMSGIDNARYPSPRIYTFGVNLSF
ncbi:SusC/RagA family TonB-linked outer membrane protein [Anaerophaga thermohalophila]|uniref:SusC/RagA family TonB-linked outer membrane protein n=1 Tax=Anaerophaga thermohalophila TaxID=177400 RepID=UPI0002F8D967|nr:TonB-dependent receptor [Anaerophaga thermohalophila]